MKETGQAKDKARKARTDTAHQIALTFKFLLQKANYYLSTSFNRITPDRLENDINYIRGATNYLDMNKVGQNEKVVRDINRLIPLLDTLELILTRAQRKLIVQESDGYYEEMKSAKKPFRNVRSITQKST